MKRKIESILTNESFLKDLDIWTAKRVLKDGWPWGKFRCIDFKFPGTSCVMPDVMGSRQIEGMEGLPMFRTQPAYNKGVYYVLTLELNKIVAVLEKHIDE